jgi:hypothetical protein
MLDLSVVHGGAVLNTFVNLHEPSLVCEAIDPANASSLSGPLLDVGNSSKP